MISASHNHFESNGIKIFSSEGVKIPDKAELLIEKYLLDHKAHARIMKLTNLREVGIVLNDQQKKDDYINYICKNHNHYLKGMKIVIDCANGATSALAPEVFKRLGAKIVPIHCTPTGININGRCGSLYPEVLRRSVLKQHAWIGFSFDGDGDRVLVTDEKGIIRDGDYVMSILARYYKKHHQLPKNTIVGTVMSNTGLEVVLNEVGIKLIRTAVGDRNVADKMFRNGYIIGGEQSGHIILLNHSVTGDGLITALELLKIMKSEGKPLSRLADCMQKYPQVLVNLKVKSKPELTKINGYQDKVNELRNLLGANSQLLIRYSGTEPLLRIMIEAKDKRKIKSAAKDLVKFFRSKLR
jgi:phosphoglucosamine mutase